MKTTEVLVYYGKHGDEYWLADSPERKDAALRALFSKIDEEQYYDYLEDDGHDYKLYVSAKTGDLQAIRNLLESRRTCEYEMWDFEVLTIPDDE